MLQPKSRRYDALVSLVSGLGTGFLAGLIGLGGAEERIWVILYLLEVPLRVMFLMNLLLSLLTTSTSAFIRFELGVITPNALNLALTMILTSPIGGYLGSVLCHRSPERALRYFLASILLFVSIELALGAFSLLPKTSIAFTPSVQLILAAILGFFVGVIAGLIGVAGGEYRIPVFILVFGTTTKVAGTASQIVSVPTVFVSILKHRGKTKLSSRENRVTIWLGVGSFFGVLLGLAGLVAAPDWLIRLIFAVVLFYTSVRLYRSPLSLNQSEIKHQAP
jgi:uncharacterized protein